MTVYLLHFHRPISERSTAQHYIGHASSSTLKKRIAHHRQGTSKARLLEVAHERGIGFDVVRVWKDGDRALERRLKRRKNAWQLCPICRAARKKAVVSGGLAQLDSATAF